MVTDCDDQFTAMGKMSQIGFVVGEKKTGANAPIQDWRNVFEFFADSKNLRSVESMPSWRVRLFVETYRCVGASRRHAVPHDSTHWNSIGMRGEF
jgi:hypothetical protein